MSGKLYVVGTPIGNLGDLSPRAAQTLADVDFIAAEDTRVTLKLLNRFDIHTPLISYHDHNRLTKGDYVLDRILSGEDCAVVSDAGMPAISDPGEDLVRLCRERGVEVVSVPGPSAVVTALAMSGMDCGRFCFEGFLSMNKPSRREHLNSLRGEKRTMVFYEAPHKLNATLADFLDAFGDRQIALVKELTKIHENVHLTTLEAAVEYYAENQPKGEYVLVVAGAPEEVAEQLSEADAIKLALGLMEDGMPASKAAKRAAAESGVSRSEIYKAITQN